MDEKDKNNINNEKEKINVEHSTSNAFRNKGNNFFSYNEYISQKIIKEKMNKLIEREMFKKRLAERYSSIIKKLNLTSKISKNEEATEVNLAPKEDFKKIIEAIKKENNKDPKDILTIKNFLINCRLKELFHFTNDNEEIIDKILINFCNNCKHKILRKNTTIYRINDIVDNICIIIRGKVGIYKPFNSIAYMSGFKYFQYIYDLYLKNENYMLKIVLEQNYRRFPIKENMIPKLNIHVADILIKRFNRNPKDFVNIFKSTEDLLRKCFIDPFYYVTKKYYLRNDDFIYELFCRLFDYNAIYILEYHLLQEFHGNKILEPIDNQEIINEYNTFTYKIAENKNYHDKFILNEKRQYTAKILSETDLCFIDFNNHYNFVLNEYKKILKKDAKYLIDNFIFKGIGRYFEKKYFPYFSYEEIDMNSYLFRENKPVEYIYFLKEGIIELTINKDIFQIHSLLKRLNYRQKAYDKFYESEENKNINDSENMNYNIDKVFKSKDEEKRLVIMEEKEIIGMECLYYDINYFYNAKSITKKSVFYKIRTNKFMEIIDLENSVENKYINESERKMEFLISRLFNLNKVKFNLFKLKNIKFFSYNDDIKKGKNIKKLNIKFLDNNKIKINEEILKGKNKHKHNKNKYKNSYLFSNTFLTDKHKKYESEGKNHKILENFNNNRNSQKIQGSNKKSVNSGSEIELYNNTLPRREYSFFCKKIIDVDSDNNEGEKINNSKFNLFPEVLTTPKKEKKQKSMFLSAKPTKKFFNLKTEELLINKIQRQMTYDDLLFSKIVIKSNTNENNNFNNIEDSDNFKSQQEFKKLYKNSSYNNEYIPWKSFHNNINIKPLSNKRRMKEINWYKNMFKQSDVEDNYKNHNFSPNNFIFDMKNRLSQRNQNIFKKTKSFFSLKK